MNATDDSDAEGSGLTYSLTPTGSSFDNDLFTLNAASGALSFMAAPDFEAPADANTDNLYVVQVTVTDSGGLTDLQNITVTVQNINDAAPTAVDDGGAGFTIDEDSGLFTTPDVTTNDSDPEDGIPSGDVDVTVPLAPATAGTLVNNKNGTFNFTPAAELQRRRHLLLRPSMTSKAPPPTTPK